MMDHNNNKNERHIDSNIKGCSEKDLKVDTTEINDDSDIDMDGENDDIQNFID